MKLIDLDADQGYLLDGKYKIEPIVRCKDCKWYDADGEEMDTQGHCWYKNGEPVMQDMKPNDYCSYGVRKGQI